MTDVPTNAYMVERRANDALRAENERLRALQERTQRWMDEFQGKLAEQTLEVKRLQERCDKLNVYAHKIEEEARQSVFEIERLRAALEAANAHAYGP